MENKARFLTIFLTLALALSGLAAISHAQASGDAPTGPYTKILLPLEDLPALNENLAFHPIIDQYESGATLQIMYVLEDPRDVPLARYVYYTEDRGVIAPNDLPSTIDRPEYNQELEEILSQNPKTINVYVRAIAPADQSVPDPLFGDLKRLDSEGKGFIRPYNPNRPALIVYFPGYIGHPFICAVPEYINGPEPYQLPLDINGGNAVGSDGLYDPNAFAPPLPWYDNQDTMLAPGEIREGWISCMVPDMPVENILIRALYSYTPEPQSTPTPGPSPTPYDDSDCVIVDSFDDPVCSTGVCCQLSADATVEAMIDATSTAWAGGDDGEVIWEAYEPSMEVGWAPAWSYTRTASIPEDGIRLEDTSMVFINEEGDQKTALGKVLIKTANIVQIERHNFDDYVFVAEVSVEPDGLSEEDLQGYALYRIYADVEVYEQANSSTIIFGIEGIQNSLGSPYESFMGTNFNYPSWGGTLQLEEGKQPFAHMFMHEPDSPFTGYVFGNLEPERHYSPLSQYDLEWNGPIPTTLWFNIDSSSPANDEIEDSKARDLTRYAAKGENIYNTSLVSSTTMCDVVECLDVKDPEDDDHEVRTVPLMCPGEWANDFVIDGLNIEDVDYIGEPEGMGKHPATIRGYLQSREVPPKTWVYEGTILGGLSPWWSIKNFRNSARTVDLLTGNYLDSDPRIMPYYFRDADAYYLPANDSSQVGGWIIGKASDKLLIFDVIQKADSTKTNNALLFLEEGPAWSSFCSRPLLPGIISSDIYAPPLTGSSFEIYSYNHAMVEVMPGMTYPVSEPRITGGVVQLGETGPTINDQLLLPTDIKIIPGRPGKPIVYVPSEDSFYPAVKRETTNNSVFFNRVGAELIPPDSSLVMVRLKKVSPFGPLACETKPEDIQLSYPGYYPITTVPENLLEFYMAFLSYGCSDDDFNEEWLVFKFPSLALDQNKLIFSIKGEDNWVFWNLAEK